jgi:hypothetical protein
MSHIYVVTARHYIVCLPDGTSLPPPNTQHVNTCDDRDRSYNSLISHYVRSPHRIVGIAVAELLPLPLPARSLMYPDELHAPLQTFRTDLVEPIHAHKRVCWWDADC